MVEEFFFRLPPAVNILFVFIALYAVTRSSHYMVDGAVSIAHEFNVSPLVIGATVVAVGTSAAELAINMVVVLGDGDTLVVVGNILGSNLVNFGIGLGVPALIAGLIIVPRDAMEREIPLYLAATGLMTAFVHNGTIDRVEAGIMLVMFVAALALIVQYATRKHHGSELVIEMTPLEAIAHPSARELTRRRALMALFGGLAALVIASRLLIFNTAVVAEALEVPQFVIGLVIVGPGTSLPEIAAALQSVRRGHGDLVLGMAFGSNLFNLLFGLGLPALVRPLTIDEAAILSFTFMDVINLTLLALLLLDFEWLGRAKTINRAVGGYLLVTYLGYIVYEVVEAANGDSTLWLTAGGVVLAAGLALWYAFRTVRQRGLVKSRASSGTILCATRGGKDSQHTHKQAIALARARSAELIFLYVFDRFILQKFATPIVINVEEQVKQMLGYLQITAQEQAEDAGVPAQVIVRTGNLLDQLKAISEERRVSLIVLGAPAGESSLFKLEALRAFQAEVEAETSVPVRILRRDEDVIVPPMDTSSDLATSIGADV
jgi:cation:H+ antiporter